MPLGQPAFVFSQRPWVYLLSRDSYRENTLTGRDYWSIYCLSGAGDERVTNTTTGPVTRRLDTTRKRGAHDYEPMRVAIGRKEQRGGGC